MRCAPPTSALDVALGAPLGYAESHRFRRFTPPVPGAAPPTQDADDPWLPLGAASRLVGVSHDTLRRWADTGKVQSYQTPGGHRRFLRSSLEAMINAPRRHRYDIERLADSTRTVGGAIDSRCAFTVFSISR